MSTWIIWQGPLYLIKLERQVGPFANTLVVALDALFPQSKGCVLADWYTGELCCSWVSNVYKFDAKRYLVKPAPAFTITGEHLGD